MKQKPKPLVKKPTPAQKPAPKAAAPTISWMDKLEALKGKALWIALSVVALMAAVIYWDFITLQKTLLYTDIGSDSINVFYPIWYQSVKLWTEYGATSGYSLEVVMGQPVGFGIWNVYNWMMAAGGLVGLPFSFGFIEVFKALMTGLFSFLYFKRLGLTNAVTLVGVICFSWSGYQAIGSAGWYNFSAEVWLIAMVLWMAEYVIARAKLFWLVGIVSAVVIAHYAGYLLIYLTAGLPIYVFIRTWETEKLSKSLQNVGLFLVSFLAGLGLSFNRLEGLKNMLFNSGRSEGMDIAGSGAMVGDVNSGIFTLAETLPNGASEYSSMLLRAFSTNMLGIGNDFRGWMNYLEAPLLYVGLPMLLFIPFFFVGADVYKKRVYGAMLGVIALVLIFPWFRYAFWGFKLDYFREFTMLIGIVLLMMAMRGLNNFVSNPGAAPKWLAPAVAGGWLLVLFLSTKDEEVVRSSTRAMVLFLLLANGLVMTMMNLRNNARLVALILFLAVVDLGSNAHATINDRKLLSARDIEQGKLYRDNTMGALAWMDERETQPYRVAKVYPSGPSMHGSLNDAMVQGFNGLVGYNSFHNKYYLRFMRELGCIDPTKSDESKWVYKVLNRPYLSSFLGARYFLNKGRYLEFDPINFANAAQVGDVFISRSELAMPLLLCSDSYILDDDFRKLSTAAKDYALYSAVVLSTAQAQTAQGLTPYNLADTANAGNAQSFTTAAARRKAMMTVDAKETKDGLSATVKLQKPGVVVAQMAYNERMQVLVDGREHESFVGNFGFFAFFLEAGEHNLEVILGD